MSLTMVKSGWRYDYGLGFWGANGHDGVWHVALAESLNRPGESMPIFSGDPIKNYHLGFDYLVALLNKITFLPINTLYYQIIPVIMALLLGILTYVFVLNWQNSIAKAWGAVFFVYFGGSLGWLVTIIKNGYLDGESMFWAQQSISTLINPPYALSLILMLLGLIFLHSSVRKNSLRSKKYLLVTSIVFGLISWVKIYAGILVLGGLFVAGIYQQLNKKGTAMLRVFLGASIISAFLVLPVLSFDQPVLEFKPFWFLETMMAISDRLGWDKYYSAITNYKLAGNYFKLAIAYLVAFGIFIIGNFGTRLIGIIYFVKNRKYFSNIDVLLITIIGGGIIFPMLFVQTGTPWNTIQFLYYSLFIAGICAGMVLGDMLISKNMLVKMSAILIIVLTIPTTVATLYYHYLPSRPPAMLPQDELDALEFLRNQPDGVVLTYPFDPILAQEAIINPPRPLYLYESTAYVSAYSAKDVFFEDEVNLNITGYPWPLRRELIENWYKSQDHDFAYNFLRKNNIKYIYWVDDQRATLGETQLGINEIYKNDTVVVYKVN